MKHRKGAGAEVQTRPPVGQPVSEETVDQILGALPQGRDAPARAPGLMWLYATGGAGPGLAAFVEGLLARSAPLRAELMAARRPSP